MRRCLAFVILVALALTPMLSPAPARADVLAPAPTQSRPAASPSSSPAGSSASGTGAIAGAIVGAVAVGSAFALVRIASARRRGAPPVSPGRSTWDGQ